MSRNYSEILHALEQPLSFGARKDGQNFANIKNFSSVIQGLLKEAKSQQLKPEQQKLIQSLSSDFREFDRLSLKEQAQRVRTAYGRFQLKSNPHGTYEQLSPIQQPIDTVKGVGKVLFEKLKRKNVLTIEDALFDLPLRFEDRSQLLPIRELKESKLATVRGKVKGAQVSKTRRGRRILTVLIQDVSGILIAKWFFYRSKLPDKRFQLGNELILSGPITRYRGQLEIHHPEVEVIDSEQEESRLVEEKIVPIYALTEGLNQRFFRQLQRRIAQNYSKYLKENFPDSILKKFHFPTLSESILRIHCPDKETKSDLLNQHQSLAQRRIIFEELFFLSLSVELRKRKISHLPAKAMPKPKGSTLTQKLLTLLPFVLTRAQKRVLKQIFEDLSQPFAMNRLLQGDVGSGKTIVALFTALRVIDHGYQVAFMAPTEILAEQHFLTLSGYLSQLKIPHVCITGSTSKKERIKWLEKINNGKIPMVLGTHALLEEDIQFQKLGLTIIDEQHRFGVMQRAALQKKGLNPHNLVMTATPIPRTLTMSVYGDLELSIIDEMPPGRMPIKTKIYRQKNEQKLYSEIKNEVDQGHQVYIVYPLIEESETLELKNAISMFEHLQKDVFPRFALSLLHGRMKADAKEKIMNEFKSGKIQILVSTTVIEVGIDVPNATLMVIENAERFGLAQLHQLRGRVGRSSLASKCILVVKDYFTEDGKKRLKIMCETNDGFRIAEEDLRIRGPGEVLGTRQAGLPIFCYADLKRDADLLLEARKVAKEMVLRDPNLDFPDHLLINRALFTKWKGRLHLARVG